MVRQGQFETRYRWAREAMRAPRLHPPPSSPAMAELVNAAGEGEDEWHMSPLSPSSVRNSSVRIELVAASH